jgi:hypothetical protein
MWVPATEYYLFSGSSLLKDLKERSERTTSVLLKKKNKHASKSLCQADEVNHTENQSVNTCSGDGSRRKSFELIDVANEVGKVDENEFVMEATSHGAAGTLTGVKERACQEP